MKFLKVILPIAIIALITVIFCFSAQPADESDKVSKTFTREVVEWFLRFTDGDAGNAGEIAERIHGLVRKYAHLTLYMLLGVLSTLFFGAVIFRKYSLASILCAAAVCVLYACSDEYHQTFVAGRSGEVRDVLIDTLGSVIGITVVSAVTAAAGGIKKLIKKIKRTD